MTSLLRTFTALALALMLALTGQSMAHARGATGPAGQITLCTGTGPVMIYVDEDGQPTGPPVFCPDQALNLLDANAPPAPKAPVDIAFSRAVPVAAELSRGKTLCFHANARAPPFAV